MKVSNKQKIGTYFNKNNIFLATVSDSSNNTKELLKTNTDGKIADDMKCIVDMLVNVGAISSEQYDVFYKDDKGYIRFVEEGAETIIGDNSDGKGIIRNIVSIWDYYSEDQVFEVLINGEFMAICILDDAPLEKYNNDFNKL